MESIKVGGLYKHYKGNMYQVVGIAKHSETVEDMIVYKSIKTGDLWVRPAYMWNQIIDDKGTLRFTLC